MARIYTVAPQLAGDIIFTDNQNAELTQSISALNGTLDQNNMPLSTVTRAKLAAPTTVATVGPPAWDSYYFQSQSYHIAEGCAGIVEYAPNTWTMGWIAFEATPSAADRTGFVLEFEAQEGMLKGEATIDLEHRQSYYLYGYSTPAEPPETEPSIGSGFIVRDRHTGELGVFVNDVLVARTGPIWIACGRHTYTLPWASPVKSGPVKVDVRWLIDYVNSRSLVSTGTFYFVGIIQVYPVSAHDRHLWCRNEYR